MPKEIWVMILKEIQVMDKQNVTVLVVGDLAEYPDLLLENFSAKLLQSGNLATTQEVEYALAYLRMDNTQGNELIVVLLLPSLTLLERKALYQRIRQTAPQTLLIEVFSTTYYASQLSRSGKLIYQQVCHRKEEIEALIDEAIDFNNRINPL